MDKVIQVASNLTIDIDEMTAFIKEGKLSGYASGIKPIYDPITKIKRLVYQKGPWVYVDEFRGSFMAPGTETVYYGAQDIWDEKQKFEQNIKKYLAVWQMSYAGGMLPQFWQEKKISDLAYDVLKLALQNPDQEIPLRGPGEIIFHDVFGDLGRYFCGLNKGSNILLFSGTEEILLENQYLSKMIIDWPQEGQTKAFFQYFSGSIIVYNHQKV